MPKFPFIGTRVEVISYDGVRYAGELEVVNSSVKSITLVRVHHYGTEDRHFEGHLPKEGKGALPEEERRVIFAEYILGLRVVDDGAKSQAGNDDNAAQPQVNEASTGAGELRVEPLPLMPESSIRRKVEIDMRPSSSDSTTLHRTQSTHPYARMPDRKGEEQKMEGGDAGENGIGTSLPYPHYFIAQLQVAQAVGVLINPADFSSAPAYMAIDYSYFPISPVPCQVWAVRRYRWLEERRHMVCHQFVKSEHPEGLNAFMRLAGGLPWMYDYMINQQGCAVSSVELVHDAETVISRGQIVAIHDKPNGWRFVEIEAPGLVEGIRLLEMQYDLRDGGVPYSRLKCGHAVNVEMVKLDRGCWVGPKYVLPNIGYQRDKPPFKPCLLKRYRTTRTETDSLFPFRFST